MYGFSAGAQLGLCATVFTIAQRQAYDKDGFVLIPPLFDAEEISLISQDIEQDPVVGGRLFLPRQCDAPLRPEPLSQLLLDGAFWLRHGP